MPIQLRIKAADLLLRIEDGRPLPEAEETFFAPLTPAQRTVSKRLHSIHLATRDGRPVLVPPPTKRRTKGKA